MDAGMNEDEAKRLVLFMADFCWNCTTEISFQERVAGREDEILRHFKRGVHGWSSAASIHEGGEPE